jgi:hypothetical protein
MKGDRNLTLDRHSTNLQMNWTCVLCNRPPAQITTMNWKNRDSGQRPRTFEPQSWGNKGQEKWTDRVNAIRAFIHRSVRDTALTVVAGVSVGVMFCLVALLIFLFRGFQPFDSNHVSVIRTLTTYLVAGALGGLVVGLTLPLTRWMPGAALVAFLAAFVVWFAVGRSISPQEPLLATAHASAVLGAAFGLPIGVGFWYQNRLDKRTGKWY